MNKNLQTSNQYQSTPLTKGLILKGNKFLYCAPWTDTGLRSGWRAPVSHTRHLPHTQPVPAAALPSFLPAINITVTDNSQVNHAITFCFPFQE